MSSDAPPGARRTKRTPKGTPKGMESRAQILEAAAPIFAEYGYRGASLAAVADAAGMTSPGLLHHFHSKEQLLLALLEDRYHADGKILERHRPSGGLALLRALGDIVKKNRDEPESARLFTTISSESITSGHPGHAYFVERYRKVRRRINSDLGAERSPTTAGVDLAALSLIIVGVMDGIQAQWLLDPEVDMVGGFELFCELLARAVLDPS